MHACADADRDDYGRMIGSVDRSRRHVCDIASPHTIRRRRLGLLSNAKKAPIHMVGGSTSKGSVSIVDRAASPIFENCKKEGGSPWWVVHSR